MKKLFSIVFFAICTFTFAQTPQKMTYQAVIRNASNNLVVSSTVGMRLSILQGSTVGPAVYVETQMPSTNANGLVSVELGAGTVVSGAFSTINWGSGGPYFIKTETDPTGGTSYSIFGSSQLNSVPYALYSEKANTVNSVGQDVYEVFGNAQLVVSSSTTIYTIIPGLSQTINIPANCKVYVSTNGGLQCTATGNAFSVVDVAIYVDAVISPQAGVRRVVAANTTGIAQVITNWSFGRTYTLSAGNHTFDVRAIYPAGSGASTANVSSGSAPQLQGVLTVMIIKN